MIKRRSKRNVSEVPVGTGNPHLEYQNNGGLQGGSFLRFPVVKRHMWKMWEVASREQICRPQPEFHHSVTLNVDEYQHKLFFFLETNSDLASLVRAIQNISTK